MRAGVFVLGAVLVSAILLSLMVGQVMLSPADLWTGLWGGTGPGALSPWTR